MEKVCNGIDDPDVEVITDPSPFLASELNKTRSSGLQLARSAIYVIENYDGLHRLSAAVSNFMRVIADEGGRCAECCVEDN